MQCIGCASRGVLRITLLWVERHDALGTTVVHHIQCGGGRSGPPLGIIGSGKSLGWQQQRKCGTSEEGHMRLNVKADFFLRRRRYGSLRQPRVSPDRVLYADGALWPFGSEQECPENCGDGLPPMLGGRGTGRRSIYPADEGVGEELQGETAGAG